MRQLYALILATGLCVPSLALAAAPDHRASLTQASAHQPMVKAAGQRGTQASHVTSRPVSPSTDKTASDDKARYAEKEAQSGKAQSYRGGDTVVIGASALTVVLVVLLIVILI